MRVYVTSQRIHDLLEDFFFQYENAVLSGEQGRHNTQSPIWYNLETYRCPVSTLEMRKCLTLSNGQDIGLYLCPKTLY